MAGWRVEPVVHQAEQAGFLEAADGAVPSSTGMLGDAEPVQFSRAVSRVSSGDTETICGKLLLLAQHLAHRGPLRGARFPVAVLVIHRSEKILREVVATGVREEHDDVPVLGQPLARTSARR